MPLPLPLPFDKDDDIEGGEEEEVGRGEVVIEAGGSFDLEAEEGLEVASVAVVDVEEDFLDFFFFS